MTIFATVLGALHGAVERHKMNELESRLDQRASQIKPFMEWRKSVVDLLKLLGVDNSYEHRIMLAQKFGYRGQLASDHDEPTSAMNVWLHHEIMQRVVDNGGRVPREMM